MKLEKWQEIALEIELLKVKNLFLANTLSRMMDMLLSLGVGLLIGYMMGINTVVKT
jgi:hypothetical protein